VVGVEAEIVEFQFNPATLRLPWVPDVWAFQILVILPRGSKAALHVKGTVALVVTFTSAQKPLVQSVVIVVRRLTVSAANTGASAAVAMVAATAVPATNRRIGSPPVFHPFG
jgi:hypothetical protein